jgi:hypothetical protein
MVSDTKCSVNIGYCYYIFVKNCLFFFSWHLTYLDVAKLILKIILNQLITIDYCLSLIVVKVYRPLNILWNHILNILIHFDKITNLKIICKFDALLKQSALFSTSRTRLLCQCVIHV